MSAVGLLKTRRLQNWHRPVKSPYTPDDLLRAQVELSVLTTRTLNRLLRNRVYSKAQLESLSDVELLGFPMFGEGSLLEVRRHFPARLSGETTAAETDPDEYLDQLTVWMARA